MRRPVPPPVKTAVIDAQAYVTNPWAMFFQSLYKPIHEGTLANKPVNLRSQDEGLLFHATDFDRWFRWNGSSWERAPQERPTAEIAFFAVTPGTGWRLCDGAAAITRTNADATTTSVTMPNLVGRYVKGGAAYTGANVAAVAPGLTGSTASATTGITTDSAGGGGEAQSGAGAATTGSHSHGVTDPGHSHGVGTLAVDAAGEPAHVVLLPYYRL